MSSPTTFLITGAARGLGRALTAHYLLKPNSWIAAAVRDPAAAVSLLDLPKGEGSSIVLVKIESVSDTDPKAAVEVLMKEHRIDHLDLVISSAGICRLAKVEDVDIAELREHVEVNAIAVVKLFQATISLLQAAKAPKFVILGSNAGSIGMMEMFPFPQCAYSSSKAMVNSLIRKIQMENPWLITCTLHPGWAQTDMGNDGAKAVGMKEATVTIEDSIAGTVAVIEKATNKLGPFLDYEGKELPW